MVFFTGRTLINAKKKIIKSKSHKKKVFVQSWYLCLIKSYLAFFYLGIDLKDDFKSLN